MISRKNQAAPVILAIFLTVVLLPACGSRDSSDYSAVEPARSAGLADSLLVSLEKYIIDSWYPVIIDTLHGGYISDLNYDWTLTESSQKKALVQQARHVWATSFLYQFYPGRKDFLEYSAHGFRFLRDHMWDKEFGGFHAFCLKEGDPDEQTISDKRIYGEAFAVYGLSHYYLVSRDEEALDLAKKAFLWMEEHAHDHEYGGYFEFLMRDGTPLLPGSDGNGNPGDSPATGLKDYNSSIHLMEAFTALYSIWPDTLVRKRLEEMFYLIRDTFVHPDGYLQLYFYPDWTLVPDETFTRHITYGHDVETAYLLLETADILGFGEDEKTHRIAKRLVDHSLESGWDKEAGGFYDAGKEIDGEIRIINDHKAWWSQIEGLNALVLMHTLHPDDPRDYFSLALRMWEYIDRYLIDKKYGGWYNQGLDITPESRSKRKSHAWKTSYHTSRGMVNGIRMLRGEYKAENSIPL